MRMIDLTGQRFGRLVVSGRANEPGRRTFWLCICDCGQATAVSGDSLRFGRSESCGCLRKEVTAARSRTHGHRVGRKASREWKSWSHAKGRCHCPTDAKYPVYGARGISMCAAWRESFETFLADMGPCPPGHAIDRINVNGNYEPGNCQWATDKQQANNKTTNVRIDWRGDSLTLKQVAELEGVDYKALHNRVRVNREPVASAVAALS